ncbi:alpha-amylase family glycosyl hydrolase [Oceanobacillus senegalensis]|uniref:alpha-amylase family glycosyl hydrolase n=1 Tax=Oceanobacillus senegalensis TaxID=1936063 RepID=UPI000A3048B8|nr:alpha-amylase family glycosyl hydrolase [Oceanobacillus senegalensis]
MKKLISIVSIISIFFLGWNPATLYAAEEEIQEEFIYSILIDRYNNGDHSNDEGVNTDDPLAYHGGDFQGIIDKLDDLVEVGVTTISLSPIMNNSEKGYHGYWVEDFYEVEEQFGTLEEFNLLIEEAHKRNIKVVMEFMANYVSPNHPFVQDSEKENWILDNQEIEGPKWTSGAKALNLDNTEVQEYITDVAKYWMEETDIDGLHFQAIDQIPIDFLEALTSQIREENPGFYLLGDTLITDENSEVILENTEIQVIDNPPLTEVMVETFSKVNQDVLNIYEVWESSNNQVPLLAMDDMYSKRFTQELAEGGRNALTAWKLALTYMFTTPGIPSIYQGSEIPMYGANAEEAQQLVRFNSGDSDLQEFYHQISSLRKQFPALQFGDFELVGSSNAMSVFRRSYNGETFYIAINNSSESQDLAVTNLDSGLQLRGYLGDNLVRENDEGVYRIGLARETAEVYHVQPNTGLNWTFISFVGGVFLIFIVGVIYLSMKQRKREIG